MLSTWIVCWQGMGQERSHLFVILGRPAWRSQIPGTACAVPTANSDGKQRWREFYREHTFGHKKGGQMGPARWPSRWKYLHHKPNTISLFCTAHMRSWIWCCAYVIQGGAGRQKSRGAEIARETSLKNKLEEKNQPPNVAVWPPHGPWHVSLHVHTRASERSR